MYKDPFLGESNILVLCETYNNFDDQPTESNKRKSCLEIVKKCVKDDPWFGFEQVMLITVAIHPPRTKSIILLSIVS